MEFFRAPTQLLTPPSRKTAAESAKRKWLCSADFRQFSCFAKVFRVQIHVCPTPCCHSYLFFFTQATNTMTGKNAIMHRAKIAVL